jgi:hypothetical protein
MSDFDIFTISVLLGYLLAAVLYLAIKHRAKNDRQLDREDCDRDCSSNWRDY